MNNRLDLYKPPGYNKPMKINGENSRSISRGEFRKNQKELLAWIDEDPARHTITIRDAHRKQNANLYKVMAHTRAYEIYKRKGKRGEL